MTQRSLCLFLPRSVENRLTREYKRKGSYVTRYCCWLAFGRCLVGISIKTVLSLWLSSLLKDKQRHSTSHYVTNSAPYTLCRHNSKSIDSQASRLRGVTATSRCELPINYFEVHGTVVKVLCYKSEGRWLDPSWCHWNFSLI